MRSITSIDQFLDNSIAAAEFTGAVYLIGAGDRIVAAGARGHSVITPEKRRMSFDTIFDLASLTKPLATGMLLAQFVEQQRLTLTQRLAEFFPQFDSSEKREITVGQLATHSAGFINWRPFFSLAKTPAQVLDIIAAEPLSYAPGSKVIYSDPGYITLGLLLAKVAGKPLDELARHMIFQPLGSSSFCFNPPPEWREQIAASETGNQFERKLAGELAEQCCCWRSDVIWGQVHDQNCYFLGGVAGHAGLFGRAADIFYLAQQFLPGSRLVNAETLRLFQQNFTPGCEEGRSIGWLLASVGRTAAGPALPAESFGHVGFTGTSLWIDPVHSRSYILLANRTHPVFLDFNMNERRRQFHELAQAAFAL